MPIGAPVPRVQSGRVDTGTLTAGTLPEALYVDITISAVDLTRALVFILGVAGLSGVGSVAADTAGYSAQFSSADVYELRAYLLNSTTLRVYSGSTATYRRWTFQWQVQG